MRSESAGDEVTERLAGLLPEDALRDALADLGAGADHGTRRVDDPARAPRAGNGARRRADRALGLSAGQAPPGGAHNHRNGATVQRAQTELVTVEIKTPRDRKGNFEPQLAHKRQTRLAGLDDRVLGLYGGGSRCATSLAI